MKIMTTRTTPARLNRVTLRRICWAGLLAAAVAAGGNVLVYASARALDVSLAMSLMPGTEPMPLPIGMVIAVSVVGAVAATVVFALLSRFVPHGVRLFEITGIVFLLLSFAGPLSLSAAEGATKITLVLMHIVAGGSIIGLFSRLGRRYHRSAAEDVG